MAVLIESDGFGAGVLVLVINAMTMRRGMIFGGIVVEVHGCRCKD